MKKRIFDIIQIGNKSDVPSRIYDYFITIVIVLNLIVTFWLTFDIPNDVMDRLKAVELATMCIFTVEFLLRLWTAKHLFEGKNQGVSMLLYLVSFYGLIDLFTILPYWLPIETLYGMGALRIIRVVRIFRLFRVNTQSDAYNVIVSVLLEKRNQLVSSISLIGILMLSASFLMYSVEHTAQPEVFDNAFSGLWWAVSTVLTVGYGDIYPVTTIGKLMAIVIAILGVMSTAIPTGILSAGFSENYRLSKLRVEELDETFRVLVDAKNLWAGQPAEGIYALYGIRVILIIRDGEHIKPENEDIEVGDILVCMV